MAIHEKEFIAFLFRTLLKEEFKTKRIMAQMLDIPVRTIQENFQYLDCAKGGTVAFERLILYCMEHEIDLRSLYNRYRQTDGNGIQE